MITADDVQGLRDAITAAKEEMEVQRDLRDWPDEIDEVFEAVEEACQRLDRDEEPTVADATTLAVSLERAREELEVELDLREWPEALVAVLDKSDELAKKIFEEARPELDEIEDPATIDLSDLRDDDGYGHDDDLGY